MYRSIVVYGACCGVLLTLYITMLDLTGVIYHAAWGVYLGYLAILILPICIFVALLDWNKSYPGLLLKHALFISLCTSFLAATIYSAYTFVELYFFDAQHLRNLFSYTEVQMRKAGSSTEEITAELKRLRNYYFSIKPYISTYIWYLALGLVYGFIFHIAFRFKKQKQTT